jgi:hypothetical protein
MREKNYIKALKKQTEPPTNDKAWVIIIIIIIITLENNKSPAEDNIGAELIKYGDKKLWEEIRTLIEVTWP